MKHSLSGKLSVILLVGLCGTLLAGAFTLMRFKSHVDTSTRMLTGQEKTVLLGQLLEARMKAAQELIPFSVTSQESNSGFLEKMNGVDNDLKNLLQEKSDNSLEEAKKITASLLNSAKAQSIEDIFVYYRNVKATAFNLYRTCWNYKWLNVAKAVGLIVQDLDNLPYHAAEKAAAAVFPKITNLTTFVTQAPLSQEAKIIIFGNLTQLKSGINRYVEAMSNAEKIQSARETSLKKALLLVKNYNESQSKQVTQFTNKSHEEFIKALIVMGSGVLFALFWYMTSLGRFAGHLKKTSEHVIKQLQIWIQASNQVNAPGFAAPAKADQELMPVYQALDMLLKRIVVLRREDQYIKRLLNVPFILINRSRQAVFWNSALSNLVRSRTLEETGAVHYTNLLKFSFPQGKAIDPVEKVFVERTETLVSLELNVGNEKLAVEAICIPISGPDNIDYVIVRIRDLREENRRLDAELQKQLLFLKEAVETVKLGQVPKEAPQQARQLISQCIQSLRIFAIDSDENRTMRTGQLEAAWERLNREGGIKKSVYNRLEQVSTDLQSVRQAIENLKNTSSFVGTCMSEVSTQGEMAQAEVDSLKKRGLEFERNLSRSQELISACVKRMTELEKVTKVVRSQEQVIQSIFDKSSVINANNNILSVRDELTPSEIMNMADNVHELFTQLEQSYQYIRKSVADLERGVQSTLKDLKEDLSTCVRLVRDDRSLVKIAGNLGRLEDAYHENLEELSHLMLQMSQNMGQVDACLNVSEEKCKLLLQVGKASLELQSHMERGFQGLLEHGHSKAQPPV